MKNPFNHILIRKLIIILLTACSGTLLLIGIGALYQRGFLLLLKLDWQFSFFYSWLQQGLLIDERLGRKQRFESFYPILATSSSSNRIFSRLNQELYSRTQEHTTELDRLNVELQLQMAMVQQAVASLKPMKNDFEIWQITFRMGLRSLRMASWST